MKQKGTPRGKKPKAGPSLFPLEDAADEGGESLATPVIDQWKIPKSWTWTTVGEVGDVQRGKPFRPSNRTGAHPTTTLRAANITSAGLDLSDLQEMDFDPSEREVFELRSGDIVLSEASGSPEQVGKSAMWKGELPHCCFQSTIIRFRAVGISGEFALLVFRHLYENGLFANLLRGIGIAHLGGERLGQLPFPLPPRKEQDRIVAEFGVQAERVESARLRSIQRRKSLGFKDGALVRRELGAGGGESADVPPGWQRVRLGDICEAVNGRAFKSSEWQEKGLPIIRIQNLRDANAEFNYFDGEVEDRHIVNEGDLLFAWSGTPGTSFGAFLWEGPQAALNQHIFKLTPDNSRVSNEYLYHAINQNLEDYVAAAEGGGGLAHIKRSQFLDSEVVVAPLKQQARIVKAIKTGKKEMDRQETVIDQNIQRTRVLRQALLVRAVQGKLVDQADGEGSAADQLADIRVALAQYENELKGRRKALKGTVVAKKPASQTSPKRDLHELLAEQGAMPVQELFKKAGYREEKPDEVEAFYRLLDIAMKSKKVAAEPGGDPERTRLKAAKK